MDGARFSTPPPQYQHKQNMVVVVQHGDVAHQQAADAGGQLTLTSGLPVQYQQPLQQYQQHALHQGYVGQLGIPNQPQLLQQQQQIQASAALSGQHQAQAQQLQLQQPQQQLPGYQGPYAGQPPLAPQEQQTQQQAVANAQRQAAAMGAYAAGVNPVAQLVQAPLAPQVAAVISTPVMRQSGGGAGIVRQEVTLPAGGSVMAELDQLAAAVQVTPQQPTLTSQQVPLQGTPQQLPLQQQQQQQQAYVQAQHQQQQHWDTQPPDLLPLQLQQQQQHQQHRQHSQDLTPQRLAANPTNQAGQQQQQTGTPVETVMVMQQTQQQTAQLPPPQQQQQVQPHPQHALPHGIAASGGSAYHPAPGAQLQLPPQGLYEVAATPPADGQVWCAMSDVKQQPQLQVQMQVPHHLPQQLQPQAQQGLLQQQSDQQQQLLAPMVQSQLQQVQAMAQGQLQLQQQHHGIPASPQCWGGPLAVVAQKPSAEGAAQPGSPLTYLAGVQQAGQQQQVLQQQAVDAVAAQQPNGVVWDTQGILQQQQQQQQQLQPQHLQQLQLTPQQQQQEQFVDMLIQQQQQQQPQQQQQVIMVSQGMVAMPQQMAMRRPAAALAPSPVPMQHAAVQHQAVQQQMQQPMQQQQQPGGQGLMLPPAPRPPAAAVAGGQQQQQQAAAAVPPWRQMPGDVLPSSGITTLASDREIPWSELQFGHQIGEGGFGKVYYGTWRGQPVAIKVLNPQSADSAKLMSEFNREVSTMTRLPEHPHVLKLLGVCTTPPNLALVTQYCAKGSLYGLLHSPGCYLSWVQVVAMLLDAARGMEHLHANSVLHRDLKSGNLLVDQDNMVRVADFGLSRLYHGMHTMTGGLGTFQWMAPEVLANQRYSNKADIYSFGMVMWECCARQVPFEGLNGVQAALAVMSRGMRPEIPQHTPAGLAALMQDCWAPVPEQRPGFDVVVSRLQDLLQQLQHAEVTATAAAAANRTAAALTAAASGGAMNASG